MNVARLESCSNFYSGDIPNKENLSKKRSFETFSVSDRAIPSRQWTFSSGAYNFETTTRVNSVLAEAFNLNNSEMVFRYNNTSPPFRKPAPIWDINRSRSLETPNIIDDYYYSPLSVASSQEFYVIALGKTVYKKNNGIYKLYDSKNDVRELKLNESATKVYWLEYKSRSINSVDLSNPTAQPDSLEYRPAEAVLRTFSIEDNRIYSGALSGNLVQGDIREKHFNIVNRGSKELPIGITLSKFHEDLVVVSRARSLELYDRKNFKAPLRSYTVSSPKTVAFEPTGKAQLIIGSGLGDTNVRRLFFNTDMKFEECPKVHFGRQTTALKWLDEDTLIVGLGSVRRNDIPSQRVMNVVKLVNGNFKIIAQNAPFDSATSVDCVRVLALERFGDQMLLLSSDEHLSYYPLKGVLKKEVAPKATQTILSRMEIH